MQTIRYLTNPQIRITKQQLCLLNSITVQPFHNSQTARLTDHSTKIIRTQAQTICIETDPTLGQTINIHQLQETM